MVGTIVQVNIGKGGVPKYSVPLARVNRTGLEGDAFAHPQIHGGPRQAVLLIANEVLETLAAQGYPVAPGSLGENVTMRGIDPSRMRIGQLYRLGPQVIVELTKVRVPCSTIQVYGSGIPTELYDQRVKAGDTTSPRWGKSGLYASVIEPGFIQIGDPIFLIAESA
jgi:MOSC domain-containing protein YiiM